MAAKGFGVVMIPNNFDVCVRVDDLLATKLEVPVLGYRILKRKRLTDMLRASMERKVTLIVAPPGYGKTTLLVEWLSQVKTGDWEPIWLRLDPYDNAPLRIWSYIVAGFRKIAPAFHFNPESLILGGNDRQDFTRLNALLNEIEKISAQVCLILDEYEAIHDENIHRGLGYLIDHQPGNLHIIFSSRVTPPIHFSRLRAQRQLIEIKDTDLAFTSEEINAYFGKVLDTQIDVESSDRLLDVTKGWIAGLQLATLSLQGGPISRDTIANLPDVNRQTLDFFAEEVLDQLEPEIQAFLLKTSIVDELSGPLCDALLDRDDSQERLRQIEGSNLFITSLDDRQCWYRHHPLFGEALQFQLRKTHPEIVADLHRRACAWYLENRNTEKAVSHALAAGDLEKAAEIVDACAMRAIIGYDLTSLIQWISRFSDDLLIKRPRLGIYYAVANFQLGRPDQIEPKLQAVERMLAVACRRGFPDKAEKQIRWEMASIRAVIHCAKDYDNEVISRILELIGSAPAEDGYFSGFLDHCLAEIYCSTGSLEKAAEAYQHGCQFALQHELKIGYIHSCCGLARIRKLQGRLWEAEREYQRALKYAFQAHLDVGAVALARMGIVEIDLERGKIQGVEAWVQEIVKHYDRIVDSALVWPNIVLLILRLAKYYLDREDIQRASFYLNAAKEHIRGDSSQTAFLPYELFEVRVRIYLGSPAARLQAYPLIDEMELPDLVGEARAARQLALAQIYLARHEPARALPVLLDLEAASREWGMGDCRIKTLALLARTYQAGGNQAEALKAIGQALLLAKPEGYIQVFVDQGEAIKTLLKEYSSRPDLRETRPDLPDPADEYIRRVLYAFEDSARQPANHPDLALLPETDDFSASLSQRESEVYAMLVAGRSAKEIASALSISINTAKAHVKNIYKKKGPHSRKVIFS